MRLPWILIVIFAISILVRVGLSWSAETARKRGRHHREVARAKHVVKRCSDEIVIVLPRVTTWLFLSTVERILRE
jgi:hypothetical protein